MGGTARCRGVSVASSGRRCWCCRADARSGPEKNPQRMQIALIEPIANSTRAITGLRQDRGERKLARRRATRAEAQGSGCAYETPFVNELNGFSVSRTAEPETLLGS